MVVEGWQRGGGMVEECWKVGEEDEVRIMLVGFDWGGRVKEGGLPLICYF